MRRFAGIADKSGKIADKRSKIADKSKKIADKPKKTADKRKGGCGARTSKFDSDFHINSSSKKLSSDRTNTRKAMLRSWDS